MTMSIVNIHRIEPEYAKALQAAGIANTSQLLFAGAEPQARSDLARRCGISESLILKWVGMSDLFRVYGVDPCVAELLEAVGVSTVADLRVACAGELEQKLTELNACRQVVDELPSLQTIEDWICQAKRLNPTVRF